MPGGPSERIKFSMEHCFGKSVIAFERSEWRNMIRWDGEPTDLELVPVGLSAVGRDATLVACAASGEVNMYPGLDVVRLDEKDDPCIYNIDHYAVIENFQDHPEFPRVVQVAGVECTGELANYFSNHVFMLGPYKKDFVHHHAREIPEHIANAKRKQAGDCKDA